MQTFGVLLVVVTVFVVVVVKLLLNRLVSREKETKQGARKELPKEEGIFAANLNVKLKILYGSQTGTAKHFAEILERESNKRNIPNSVGSLENYDSEDLVTEKSPTIVILLISTYEGGQPPASAAAFVSGLIDMSNDFRFHKTHLEALRYALFGLGNRAYDSQFNAVGRSVDVALQRLSAKRLIAVGEGDASEDQEAQFSRWLIALWAALAHKVDQHTLTENSVAESYEEDSEGEEKEPIGDVEDLGVMAKALDKKKKNNSNQTKQISEENTEAEDSAEEEEEEEVSEQDSFSKEMLNPTLRKALTKQGYRLIGSHSGVKLCRWTKAMLRGRGGCYKHTFYGISSFQCMEMTPSLACANKCVFCWRHHKNPVGKEWRWKVDDPQFLIENAVKNHKMLVRELKGMPGVKPERFKEAATIRHCALSLVGEPIIYPHINEFLDMLHERQISTFLVTNAQFPDKIEKLRPVTQLYVSVDAATKESLKKIDRPLFEDFWERFLECFDSLAKKGQRTVFRLTLVKEWNMEEIANYGELVGRGRPDFVEIKGVTFCGTSKASSLRMTNIPFHHEVRRFSQALCETKEMRGLYDFACEHEHSCCVLLAKKDPFFVNGQWHTWINYDRFHELTLSGEPFSSKDYMAPTPYWALAYSNERGFDPNDIRFKRKTSKPASQGC